MSTDRTLTPLEMMAGSGYRFKIEVAFKQARHTLGTYADHFWMRAMTPRPRRSGNPYLHRKPADYRAQVHRKLEAYHRYVPLGCIAQGRLQYLALTFRVQLWSHLRQLAADHEPGTVSLRGGRGPGAAQHAPGISREQARGA